MAKYNNRILVIFIVCITLITSACGSFDKEDKSLPNITFKWPAKWNSISENGLLTFYSDSDDFKTTVSYNRYLDGKSLQKFVEDIIAHPEGFYVTDPSLTVEDFYVLDQAAKNCILKGTINNSKIEYRIVGFIYDQVGYIFTFSQDTVISDDNNKAIDRLVKSIAPKER